MADTNIQIDFTKKFEKPEGELSIELDCYNTSQTSNGTGSNPYGSEFEGQ
jgi:hypothetical protein